MVANSKHKSEREDFKTMTREDLKCLMLPLGQEIRIWKAIQQETHDSLS